MLDQDEPAFANWDQDETALAERYDLQDPAVVGPDLVAAAEAVAATYDGLIHASEETWARKGFRSDGSEFTVDSLARYHLHDVLHHSDDVRDTAARATVSAYDGNAVDYSDAHLGAHRRAGQGARRLRRVGRRRGRGARRSAAPGAGTRSSSRRAG